MTRVNNVYCLLIFLFFSVLLNCKKYEFEITYQCEDFQFEQSKQSEEKHTKQTSYVCRKWIQNVHIIEAKNTYVRFQSKWKEKQDEIEQQEEKDQEEQQEREKQKEEEQKEKRKQSREERIKEMEEEKKRKKEEKNEKDTNKSLQPKSDSNLLSESQKQHDNKVQHSLNEYEYEELDDDNDDDDEYEYDDDQDLDSESQEKQLSESLKKKSQNQQKPYGIHSKKSMSPFKSKPLPQHTIDPQNCIDHYFVLKRRHQEEEESEEQEEKFKPLKSHRSHPVSDVLYIYEFIQMSNVIFQNSVEELPIPRDKKTKKNLKRHPTEESQQNSGQQKLEASQGKLIKKEEQEQERISFQ